MTGNDIDPFRPASSGPTALFLDTSGLFAYFHPEVREHDRVSAFFERVGRNEIPYRPLLTSTYIVDELVTLLLSKGTHEYATTALDRVLDSESIDVIPESPDAFSATRDRIDRFEDRSILIQRENPAVYGGRKSRKLSAANHRTVAGWNPNV
jgi:predicted nucleic acid-binding protein